MATIRSLECYFILVMAMTLQTRSVLSKVWCGTRYLYASETQNHVLTSPGYPSNYSNNLCCVWILYASPGKNIKITFTRFDTELGFDHVEIRDGQSSYSRLLARYSGTRVSSFSFVSSGTKLWIRFTTDSSRGRQGFRALYGTKWSPVQVGPTVLHNVCGETYLRATANQQKVLTSPGYPSNYPSSVNCTWIITASPGQHVKIIFTKFDTERVFSGMEIRDGPYKCCSPLLTSASNTATKSLEFVSSGPKLRIDFWTNGSRRHRRFKAFYCGQLLSAKYIQMIKQMAAALTIVTSAFFFSLFLLIYCGYKKKQLRTLLNTHNTSHQPNATTSRIIQEQTEETGSRTPPWVNEAAIVQENSLDDPPPSYEQVIASM